MTRKEIIKYLEHLTLTNEPISKKGKNAITLAIELLKADNHRISNLALKIEKFPLSLDAVKRIIEAEAKATPEIQEKTASPLGLTTEEYCKIVQKYLNVNNG